MEEGRNGRRKEERKEKMKKKLSDGKKMSGKLDEWMEDG